MPHLYFAPLDGITTVVFRRVYSEHFGAPERFTIPFISPTGQHLITPRDFRQIDPEANAGLNCVPQIMTHSAADLIWASQTLRDLGYREIDLNLGCPSGTVVAKGKGSGFLRDPEALDRFFDEAFRGIALPLSVKTRLGLQSADEFPALLAVYERYPLTALTIHPRVQKQFYRGAVDEAAFAAAYDGSSLPLIFSGDVTTPARAGELAERYPHLAGIALGRGAIADPALFRKIRGGENATREELQSFTRDLYQAYRDFYGKNVAGGAERFQAAQRMREIWFYLIHLFEGGEKLGRELRRSKGPVQYEALEAEIFATLPLLSAPAGALI